MKKTGNMSRRGFIKATALAAAPAIIPASAWGSNDRITLGIIGLGKLGREAHLPSFLGVDDVQVDALCDVETGRLQESLEITQKKYAERTGKADYKGIQTTGDFREVLARKDIDAVVIATPDHWHALPSIYAAKAGKDIYCEKPMTRTVEEGRAVVNAVRRYGRVFQTGSQQRSSGPFAWAVDLVRKGAIGELKRMSTNVGPPPHFDYELPAEPVPPTLDWDMWQGPAPARPYNSTLCPLHFDGFPAWRHYIDYAGGQYSDFGAHNFDIAQWAVGMDHSGPVEVIPPEDGSENGLIYRYENGVELLHGGTEFTHFVGTKGEIMADRSRIRANPESILKTPFTANDVRVGRPYSHRDDWLHCIRTRELPIADVEIGHRTMTVCQIGIIGYRLGRKLDWDPVAERFTNDDEANRFLSRPMRAPWRI